MYTYDLKCPDCGATTTVYEPKQIRVGYDTGTCNRCQYEDGKTVRRVVFAGVEMPAIFAHRLN